VNVFVLNAGRVGSTSFIRACEHITNYSAGHETRWGRLGADRFAYPERHIEGDNRLSWFLGRLDRAYGADAFYVHLRRDDAATAKSFSARREVGIMRAYRRGMVRNLPTDTDTEAISLDYLDTVNSNIELFLRDKPLTMDFALENAAADFKVFWDRIEAEGVFEAAVAEFDFNHNATEGHTLQRKNRPTSGPNGGRRARRRLMRVLPTSLRRGR
jgi:hypothetical protein